MATMYFHSPCLDGVVSAVLTATHLRDWGTWAFEPVGYDVKDRWPSLQHDHPFAVVDFLFHPSADFWADHHETAFLSDDDAEAYRSGGQAVQWFYDPKAPACAELLWRTFDRDASTPMHFEELVMWATKTDAARYDSPEEAVRGDADALAVHRALTLDRDDAFAVHLVDLLRQNGFEKALADPWVAQRASTAEQGISRGLQRVRDSATIDDHGLVHFEVDSAGAVVNRYSPYLAFPKARYSVGIIHGPGSSKVTAMRNPWRDFPSAPLGAICEAFGGGGHERVGSVLIDDAERARRIADEIAHRIVRHETAAHA